MLPGFPILDFKFSLILSFLENLIIFEIFYSSNYSLLSCLPDCPYFLNFISSSVQPAWLCPHQVLTKSTLLNSSVTFCSSAQLFLLKLSIVFNTVCWRFSFLKLSYIFFFLVLLLSLFFFFFFLNILLKLLSRILENKNDRKEILWFFGMCREADSRANVGKNMSVEGRRPLVLILRKSVCTVKAPLPQSFKPTFSLSSFTLYIKYNTNFFKSTL